MKVEKVTSGNVGAMVYAARVGSHAWDEYWRFSVPEGLVGTEFQVSLEEGSPVEATLALFPPGADTETTLITDSRVQSYRFYPGTDQGATFSFSQSATHVFGFRGGAHQAPGVFMDVTKAVSAGERPGAFLNLSITELRYVERRGAGGSAKAADLISTIERERGRSSTGRGRPRQPKRLRERIALEVGRRPPPVVLWTTAFVGAGLGALGGASVESDPIAGPALLVCGIAGVLLAGVNAVLRGDSQFAHRSRKALLVYLGLVVVLVVAVLLFT